MSHLPKLTLSFLYSQVFPLGKRLKFVMCLYFCFLYPWVPLCDVPTWLLRIHSLPMPLPVKLSFLFRGCAFFKYWEKSSSPCIPYNSSALLLVLVLMVSFGTCFVLSLHLFLGCPLRMEQFPTLFSPPDKSLSYLTAHRNPSAGRPVKCSQAQTVGCSFLCLFYREERWKKEVLL